ncbi:MAG: FHA domain-containing protein [Deltaproteobacteria bacterium]|jgi:pSer/pThr/pTyr-binding forkhead associated (FHA) protein|nr:FHA domain-containing protein [Deltaproteobacteria bacterium]
MAMIVQLHEGVAIKKFKFDKPTLSLGRDPQSDIFIDNTVVSSKHAIIKVESHPESGGGPQYTIEDLNSTNSTYVNGEKITRHKLAHNDVIRIGWNHFKFINEAQADPNQTAKIKKSWIPGVYYTEEDK